MPVSLIEGESLLVIDIGNINTRAALFDIVEGEYRFLAVARVPSTVDAPWNNVLEGALQAIEALQQLTGRPLLTPQRKPIIPSQPDQSGVDGMAVTISAGEPLRTVLVGLLDEVSVESARRLAATTQITVLDALHLHDQRRFSEQMDTLLRLQPELVIIAGGVDGGASRSVLQLVEAVGLAAYRLPEEKKPSVLYAGNSALAKEIKETLKPYVRFLQTSPNIRPTLDEEDLEAARRMLADIYVQIRRANLPGAEELSQISSGHMLPTSYAQTRLIRFLSQTLGADRSILAIDLGACSTGLLLGRGEQIFTEMLPLGVGEPLPRLFSQITINDILRWSPFDLPSHQVAALAYQKALYPQTIPATQEEFVLEHAFAREILRLGLQQLRQHYPDALPPLPSLEMILLSGATLTHTSRFGQSLLTVLDAVQPIGLTSILVDTNGLLPMLGMAAERNSLLPIHVLESNAFLNLGTVVSVVASGAYGTPVLRARLSYPDGHEARIEVRYGNLEIIPLPPGNMARLSLEPARHVNIGLGRGRGGTFTIAGGLLGVIIDARGRPLELPADAVRRRELAKKWLWTMGG
ncbi:MAG: glutamate mutase L [Anaerolineales bacterium]